MKKVLLTTLLCATLVMGVPAVLHAAENDNADDLIGTFARISGAIGALYALEADGDLDYLCSATAVAYEGGRTVVLTATHCLRQDVAYLINFGDNNFHSVEVWKLPHYLVSKEKFPKDYNEPDTDMALLLMDGLHSPLLEMGSSKGMPPGAPLAMVGFPQGLAKVRYEGIISGRLDRPGSARSGYLILQIFGAPGSSGSSVVSLRTGKIVGVLVGDAGKSGGLPVIFATPIDYQENLMIVPGQPGSPMNARDEE